MSDMDLPLAVRIMQDGYLMKIDALQAENAKLRELVRDMWEYIYIGTAQDGQSLHDRMRELGVSE